MNKKLYFSLKLKYEREKQGWSQQDLASKVKCNVKTVARWESGMIIPSLYYQQELCKIFGKSIDEFRLIIPPTGDTKGSLISQTSNQHSSLLTSFDADGSAIRSSTATAYHALRGLPLLTHPGVIQQREQVVKAIYSKLIQPDTTALVLTGIGGIGKSILAALVHRYVWEHHQTSVALCMAEPIWLTVNEHMTITDVIGTLFEVLGKPFPVLRDLAPYNQITMLLHILNTEFDARLIVLDQFENVLDWQTGYALPGCAGIGEWLDAINSQPCACKMLLTSRVWPKGTREYPPTFMQEYVVEGLDTIEGVELLRKQGLEERQATDEQLQTAVTCCSGHALALALLATRLRQNPSLSLSLFFKDVHYVQQWHADIAHRLLDFIYTRQLDELQRKLLFAFSTYHEAVSLEVALAVIELRGEEETRVHLALGVLLSQHLLKASGAALYSPHRIVADYIRQRDASEHEDSGLLFLKHCYSSAQS